MPVPVRRLRSIEEKLLAGEPWLHDGCETEDEILLDRPGEESHAHEDDGSESL